MTVREIVKMAAALVGDHLGDDPDELEFAVPYMNILLQEAMDCENSMREQDGAPPLTDAPYVSNVDNGVPYHDSLVRAAFPYGLAWQYHQENGNHSLASQYRNMFIDAVNRNYRFRMRRYK